MKKTFVIFSTLMTMISCGNPFLSPWDTPYAIPDFGKVREKHYIPAVQAGIAQQQAEIQAIVDCEEAPTFENVV